MLKIKAYKNFLYNKYKIEHLKVKVKANNNSYNKNHNNKIKN